MNHQEIRTYLHRHPEVSNEEFETSKWVQAYLRTLEVIDEFIALDDTGFAAVIRGKKPGQRIVLRCELDALPIQEVNDFDYKSVKEGVSHKCGHDGHMTIMIEVARSLSKLSLESGEIVLLFQSAEETGDGAVGAIRSPNFDRIAPDYIYALHNIPKRPLSQIMIKDDAFTPSVKSVIMKFHGKTSHAAEPERGYNPATLIADAIKLAEEMTHPEVDSDEFFLITPIWMTLGEKAYGISAGYGELHLTIRSWSEELLVNRSEEYLQIIKSLTQKANVKLEHEWCFEFQANVNHTEATSVIREAAAKTKLDLFEMKEPFKFGEDFGIFTQKFRGAMFGIGSGVNTPALHNPDYDYPDALTLPAAEMFMNVLKSHLTIV